MRPFRAGCLALCALVLLVVPQRASAQQDTARQKGWEYFFLPALNFSSDEGFGYGALAEFYDYGNGARPYRLSIRPTLFLTTKGRRDVVVFIDAPKLLPRGWRLDAFLGREQQLAAPYYSIGNTTPHDTTLEGPNPYYYRYGRTQIRINGNLQHRIGSSSARALMGVGFVNTTTDATPFDSGTTLFAQQLAGAPLPGGNIVFARGGVVWDTRDREVGPTRGTWADLLVQELQDLRASHSYQRVTLTARQYLSLTDKLVFAQRVMVQQVSGAPPLYDYATIQTSFKQQEGLGGGETIRGVPKNRYIGKGIEESNSELRWRFADFRLRGKPAYLVASGFFDAGRVWAGDIAVSQMLSQLHLGYGAGLRLGLGPSFVVAFDVGMSSEATQLYIGLGYPF